MKPHADDDPYTLRCSPGVAPVLNWKGLGPVDWSGLPRLKNRVAELQRFKAKWEAEYLALKLPMQIPTIPQIRSHEQSIKKLKEMRKESGLPLKEFVDWRGITRSGEDALAEFYILARKYCVKMRGTGAKTPRAGQGFFPNLKKNGYPHRELERAADYIGSQDAYKKPWAIGPKAKPFRGLREEDWKWLARQYPGDYWKTFLDCDFYHWHLNNRAAWAYNVASVRIRRSEMKQHPAPAFNLWMYNEWVRSDYLEKRKNGPIDTQEDQAILDERMRLDEAFEAHQL